MKKTIYLLGLLLMTTSCATHVGYVNDSASLSGNNFTYVKNDIAGESTATYILGFGGLAKQAIAHEAKKDMLSKNPLDANQTIANVSVNFKTKYLFLFNQVKCTVTADVVEFK